MQNVHQVNPSGKAAWYRRGFMAVWLTRRVTTSSRAARKHDVKRCRDLLTNKPSRRQTRQTDRRGRCQGERGMPSRSETTRQLGWRLPPAAWGAAPSRKQEGSRKSLLPPADVETWCPEPTIAQIRPWCLPLIYVLDCVKSAEPYDESSSDPLSVEESYSVKICSYF